MREEEIGAKQAVRELAREWETEGRRPTTDSNREKPKEKLGILKPKIKEGLNEVGASQWKQLKFCLDSGAGEIVISEDDLPEVETTASWGSKHGQTYEVANGDEIDNEGEKKFIAHMVTVDGQDSGGKGITAQVCRVHRPLMSVKKRCRNEHRVVFDDEGSYVENKNTGERIKVVEEDGEYVLNVWVKTGEQSGSTFGGQANP